MSASPGGFLILSNSKPEDMKSAFTSLLVLVSASILFMPALAKSDTADDSESTSAVFFAYRVLTPPGIIYRSYSDFAQTCSGISYSGTTIFAICEDGNGGGISITLDLSKYLLIRTSFSF